MDASGPQRTTTSIEDYALIGDCETAALVSRDGSIDWLCFPRFDSPACFAALLGTPEHGRWLLAPAAPVTSFRRRYLGDTAILETEFTTAGGVVAVIDFMPVRSGLPDVVRIVVGRLGQVQMRMDLIIRFDYGSVVPWVRRIPGGISAIAGPDGLLLHTPVPLRGEQFHTVSDFLVSEGQRVPFDLTWFPSHQRPVRELIPEDALQQTEQWWSAWAARCTVTGPWREPVMRSLITLKALTYRPSGAIVAAPTTSLPEKLGGVRNWDYRYCWLRDATFTLLALLNAGYTDEARAWREWLVRAVAGRPDQIQMMYGIEGERRLTEIELPWLPGFALSRPVRIGNAAFSQFQLDVFGEVVDATYQAWRKGVQYEDEEVWRIEKALVTYLESAWMEPDEGIWEVRGPRRHFTHSKVMAWVAVDRAVKAVDQFGLRGPVDRWRALRETIHRDVCSRGFDADQGAFVQAYGSKLLDASLLMLPLVGFLPASDTRIRGTVEAIEKHLTHDGFVSRYDTVPDVDGLPPGEASFLLCSFWLVDNLALLGRHADAQRLFERLLLIRNDVGLLAEGYDTHRGRQAGNFPQAFSHVGLINSALNLSRTRAPAVERGTE